jgi:hypothetical protein
VRIAKRGNRYEYLTSTAVRASRATARWSEATARRNTSVSSPRTVATRRPASWTPTLSSSNSAPRPGANGARNSVRSRQPPLAG